MTMVDDLTAVESAQLAGAPPGCFHGSLQPITDSERRSLRSIGRTARGVAGQTGALLIGLSAFLDVQIFQGVRAGAADGPRIPHVVSAGQRVILVESVAWPAARYDADLPSGHVRCDGVYIGQSVRPLLAAVRYWRELLPTDHQVSALVVVHTMTCGELTLPTAAGPDLAWVRAEEAVQWIQACLPGGWPDASPRAIAELTAAIAAGEEDTGVNSPPRP